MPPTLTPPSPSIVLSCPAHHYRPPISGGQPIVTGIRMRVSDLLEALAEDVSVEELLSDFSHIVREHVHACLAYAARAVDHTVVRPA